MYRTGDPRFRRRLDEIGQTLESANEQAQTSLFLFQQNYVRPCLGSITQCLTTCVEAGCPTLNLTAGQRDRNRRQRGQARGRGRAELSFDFYDDWDEEGDDANLGWGNDEFDRLLAGGESYGTITHAQPGRRRGMSYPKGRRKSGVDIESDPASKNGPSLLGKLFGGKALRYKPSSAGLQENPGIRAAGHGLTEGEALLREGEDGIRKKHRRVRSQTATSGHTIDSLSSRGDIFPSDEELDDAIPLDDEFAMVLERRTTQSGPDTESSSGHTRSLRQQRSLKRPSASSRNSRSSTTSSRPQTPAAEVPPINELKQEENELAEEEEAEVEKKRQEARKLADERGLGEDGSGKEASSEAQSPISETMPKLEQPSTIIGLLPEDEDQSSVVLRTADGGDEVKS